tara:strand:+ start:1437 stop:2165 length:729 start_codon:yes stop_codon:yes gene_type:complete
MIKKLTIFLIDFFDFFHKKKIINFFKKRKLVYFPTVFDIGAHKGESIELFLSNLKVDKIISFEASPENFFFLKKKENFLKTKFSKSEILLENTAIGSVKKKVILNQFKESSSSTISEIDKNSSYFKKKFKFLNFFKKDEIFYPIEIETENLKSYMNRNNIDLIDFLKIDTEGYEYNVLLGLEENLSKVKLIMFEHHYDNMIRKNYSFKDINKLLIENNFQRIFKAKMPFRKTFEYIYTNERF